MVVIHILVITLAIAIYLALGAGILCACDELDVFDKINIYVYDYSLAFILCWPIVLIVLIVFAIMQIVNFVILLFDLKNNLD